MAALTFRSETSKRVRNHLAKSYSQFGDEPRGPSDLPPGRTGFLDRFPPLAAMQAPDIPIPSVDAAGSQLAWLGSTPVVRRRRAARRVRYGREAQRCPDRAGRPRVVAAAARPDHLGEAGTGVCNSPLAAA